MQLRVAWRTERLEEVVAFYRDGIGLTEVGGFCDHGGYDGVFLEVPGSGAALELTAGGGHGTPAPSPMLASTSRSPATGPHGRSLTRSPLARTSPLTRPAGSTADRDRGRTPVAIGMVGRAARVDPRRVTPGVTK